MFDYSKVRDPSGKNYKLAFLPYSETADAKSVWDIIGYDPGPNLRFQGTVEEFFSTFSDAKARMRALAGATVIEQAVIYEATQGNRFGFAVSQWREGDPLPRLDFTPLGQAGR